MLIICYFVHWPCHNPGDRYDENPRPRNEGNLGEIDDWNDGKKSVLDEAVGKAKEIWNKTRGISSPDETVDYR